MKIVLIILSQILILAAVQAQEPRLLLIPVETTVKPHSKISFDVYVCNIGPRRAKVPSLEFISTISSSKKLSGKNSPAPVEIQGKTSTSAPANHFLTPNSVEWKRITPDIYAQPGDLLEVYVQIGPPPHLRSNSVLLVCPAE